MSSELSLSYILLIFSGACCSLAPKTIVFTGEIVEVQPKHQNFTVTRVLKVLFSDIRLPSVVSLRNVGERPLWNQSRTVFLFFVVPRKGSEGFDLIHYWAVKPDDFKELQTDSLKGLTFYKVKPT